MPGLDPQSLVRRVQQQLDRGMDLGDGFRVTNEYVEGDYSRFDGRQTRMVREIPFKIMSRAFRRQRDHPDRPSDRELFWRMVNAQFDA